MKFGLSDEQKLLAATVERLLAERGSEAAEAGLVELGVFETELSMLDAAVVHMNRWVRGGAPPPKAARLETTGHGDDITFVRDEQGNARGGVWHPIVDVPIARNDGTKTRLPLSASPEKSGPVS